MNTREVNTREVASQYRQAQWIERMREQKHSGQTIQAWCQANGVNRQQYFYWQRKVRRAACEQKAMATGGQETRLSRTGFAEVKLEADPCESTGAGVLRIEAGSLRITTDSSYPVEKLTALLKGLGQP